MPENPAITGERPEPNQQMYILSAIGICFVLLGHLRNNLTAIGTFNGWFPYYSFHMPLFLFITGYFFKDPGGASFPSSFGRFVWKKFKRLMIPYYVINGIFILIDMLISGWGFTSFHYSLTDWLFSPVLETQPVTFSFSTWYLAGLFFSEIFYYLLRKAASLLVKKPWLKECLLLVLIIILTSASCFLRQKYDPPVYVIIGLRSVVMLFFIHLGYLYRHHLEYLDRLPGAIYFPLVFVLQFLLILVSRNSLLSPGLYDLSGFEKFGFVYYYAGITGIALWLRISRIVARYPGKSRLILYIGRNTKYILSFHVFGFFLLNTLFYLCRSITVFSGLLTGFDPEYYFWEIFFYNITVESPQTLVLYFLAGMSLSLGLAWLIHFTESRIRCIRKRKRSTS